MNGVSIAAGIEQVQNYSNAESGDNMQHHLTIGARSDLHHDFNHNIPTQNIEIQAYNKGLFEIPDLNNFEHMNEKDFLSSVVTNENYEPINAANLNKDFCHVSTHKIQTVNDKNYTVKYADVKYNKDIKKLWKPESNQSGHKTFVDAVKELNDKKNENKKRKLENDATPKKKGFIQGLKNMINRVIDTSDEPVDDREEIDAPMFYEMMGLNVNETIAIVVDAASIGLIEILSTGTFRGVRPTVYYIFGPEVENDPATKKHPSSPDFRKTNGVNFIPCVSLNPSDFVYFYEYDPNSELYLDKFFTNFKFELSELKETPKGKIIEYTTDLTIKSFEGGKVKFIDESVDSKSKNDITFLTKIINALKTTFNPGDKNEFQYAISFLKKMSGDWLQVLLTLAITNRTRGFTPYINPANRMPNTHRENITKNIDRVFFVTHDRIALAFALLTGVECLFTHHTPVQGNPSLHSAFLYSLTSQAEVNTSILEKAYAVSRENKDYSGAIIKLERDIGVYNENYNTAIFGDKLVLDSYLKGYLSTVDTEPMHVNSFDRYVNTIFTSALAIVATKKILPDLRNINTENIRTLHTDLQTKKSEFEVNLSIENAKELLELNVELTTEIENLSKIISNAQTFFVGEGGDGMMNIKKYIAKFSKTLIYNAAVKWTWDSTEVSNRSLLRLNDNMNETVKFNADRNIFLYNLDSIDVEHKQEIVHLFARCFNYIWNNKYNNTKFVTETSPVTLLQFNKFKIMATSFCYEVFYNFGAFGINNGFDYSPVKILEYCNYIIIANALVNEWSQITENVLLMEMNENNSGGNKQILDDTITDFTVDDTESTVAMAASAVEPDPRRYKSSMLDMKCNSVSIACKLLTSRLFAGRGEYANITIRHGGALQDKVHFSPSLPIQILLFQLSKTLKNENYYESGDLELVLQYYDFLLRMRKSLSEKNKGDSEKIGLGIRELFFINNSVSEKNKSQVSTRLFNMSPKMLSLTGLLTTGFCGVLNETYFKDKESRKEIIEDPVFVEFIQSIDVPSCFKTQYDLVLGEIKYSEFVDAVSQSAREMYVTKSKSKTRKKMSSNIKSRQGKTQKNYQQGKSRKNYQQGKTRKNYPQEKSRNNYSQGKPMIETMRMTGNNYPQGKTGRETVRIVNNW